MTDQRRNPSQQMQQTTINQAQSAFEQAFELQRNATKMALSMLEMQDTAGRQGLEVSKAFMQNYLQGVEAIMPEIEETMETGMTAAMQGGDSMHGGSHESGQMGGGQMGGQQMRGGQMGGQQMSGGQQRGQRMAGGQQGGQQIYGEQPAGRGQTEPRGHTGSEMYGGESHGYDRSGQHGGGEIESQRQETGPQGHQTDQNRQPQQQRGQPKQGGYGRTGEWIPHDQGPDRGRAGQSGRPPGGKSPRGESPRRQMTTPTGGEKMETASDRDQTRNTHTGRDSESSADDPKTTDSQSSDEPEDDE